MYWTPGWHLTPGRLPPPGKSIAVQTSPKKEFLHEYVLKNCPVILTDAAAQWAALKKWTPQFFKAFYGDRKVPVFERKRAVSVKDTVYLRDYINEIPPRILATMPNISSA